MAENQEDEPTVSGPVAGPTVVRRQLGRRLRRLREEAGVSVDEVAAQPKLGISRAKLYKLEAGKHPARPQDVGALCGHYGASEKETAELTALALGTQGDSWYHVYGSDAVPEWFSLYVDLEPAAVRIRTYEAELVPGLLQTEDYAFAIYRARNPGATESEWRQRVAVRMNRQAILDRDHPKPPQLDVVLNEAVILREVGGPEVMAEQIDKLRQMATRPEITIGILPLSVGAHASMETAFVVLDFPNPDDDPSVVFMDTPSSAAYLQKPSELEKYSQIFSLVRDRVIPMQEYKP